MAPYNDCRVSIEEFKHEARTKIPVDRCIVHFAIVLSEIPIPTYHYPGLCPLWCCILLSTVNTSI